MALKDRFGETGRLLWDDWARTSDKYEERDQDKTWRTLGRRPGITIATLFHHAQNAGWSGNGGPRFNGQQQSASASTAIGPGPRLVVVGGIRQEAAHNGGAPIILTSAGFVARFVPPDYLVDGLLQEGFLYSLTGATGAGKTAITLRLAASTALGVIFAGRETKKRRVLYFAAENPTDVQMRWIALSQQMNFDHDTIEVFFVEGAFKISQAKVRLKAEAEKFGGDFGLLIIDTSPAFYEGDDENSRKQQGNHAAMLRELIDVIPGTRLSWAVLPSVVSV
jgi:AAA domain/Primase C terminal 2 (PriCT-2)